jgi:hypothetical protein
MQEAAKLIAKSAEQRRKYLYGGTPSLIGIEKTPKGSYRVAGPHTASTAFRKRVILSWALDALLLLTIPPTSARRVRPHDAAFP